MIIKEKASRSKVIITYDFLQFHDPVSVLLTHLLRLRARINKTPDKSAVCITYNFKTFWLDVTNKTKSTQYKSFIP